MVQVVDTLSMGGAQRVVVRLAAAAHARTDVAMSVVTIRPPSDPDLTAELEALGIPVRCLEPRTRGDLSDPAVMWRLTRLLRGQDVVQSHLGSANTLGPLAGLLARCPSVATLHTVALTKGERSAGTGIRRRAGLRSLRRWATTVVAVGEAVRDAQVVRTGRDDIQVIPNPAPACVPIDPSERDAARAQLGLTEATAVVTSVGRLEAPKGLDVLLTAVQALDAGVHLVLAGDGSLREDLARQAAALGIGQRVHLIGQTGSVGSVLAGADVYVCSSRREGMPMAVLEAMARGLPIVATDVGDVAAAVGGGGRIVPTESPDALAAGLREVLGDRALASQLGRESLRRAEREHGEAAWIDRWAELWHSLGMSSRRAGVVDQRDSTSSR